MDCKLSDDCGGCCLRHLSPSDYRSYKSEQVRRILQSITRQDFVWASPIFIPDGARRRASLNFRYHKKNLSLGFNSFKSKNVVDLRNCALLTPKINANLEFIRLLLGKLCSIPITTKQKKKILTSYLTEGDVWITEVDNGLDVVLEFEAELNLDFRTIIFEESLQNNDIIRISHRKSFAGLSESIIEKSRPFIKIAGVDILVPAGTFLQPSKSGEVALIGLVQKYLGETTGKIADLFCGVGTFSYPLALNMNNKITAVDSSKELLSGFQDSINHNQITNIKIINRNLFKYPLDAEELGGFSAVVLDPPRSGAKEQVRQLANLPYDKRPEKIVAVSCNPETFARDANILIGGGYKPAEITMVDQFIYSNHSELVALFTC